MREQHPQMQIQNSQTPAVTKKAIEAGVLAQQQAEQQANMMRQVLTMFSPQAQNGGQSLGSLMQPQQPQQPQQMAGGAAGQAKPSSSRNLAAPPPAGPPVDQQPDAGPPAVPPRSQARA